MLAFHIDFLNTSTQQPETLSVSPPPPIQTRFSENKHEEENLIYSVGTAGYDLYYQEGNGKCGIKVVFNFPLNYQYKGTIKSDLKLIKYQQDLKNGNLWKEEEIVNINKLSNLYQTICSQSYIKIEDGKQRQFISWTIKFHEKTPKKTPDRNLSDSRARLLTLIHFKKKEIKTKAFRLGIVITIKEEQDLKVSKIKIRTEHMYGFKTRPFNDDIWFLNKKT
ncbi:hypothetical protein CDIK_0415 [Cucumispora dikerogammari]|nr:hypothetical protein CDIK_0415 [Cucumispora dikerogammari]